MAITQIYLKSTFKILMGLCLFLPLTGCPAPQSPSSTQETTDAVVQKAFAPTWGPGQRFAFLYRLRPQKSQDAQDYLYTGLLDGTGVTRLATLGAARFKSLSWSPNGKQLLLSTEDTEDIYLIDNNGENLQKLVDGDHPQWDPTGTKFVSTHDNHCKTVDRVGGLQCQRQIRLYDIASKTFVTLPVELERDIVAPNWSADGETIEWLSTVIPKTKELAQQHLQHHRFKIASQDHQTTDMGPVNMTFSTVNWAQDGTLMAFSYLSKINLFFFSKGKSFPIIEGSDPDLSVDNTRILYSNLIGENRSDIALFDRNTNKVVTVIRHTLLPRVEEN